MTILGVDLSSNNPVFDFALAFQQGVRVCYVKLGGDNIPRYVSGSYAGRVDLARAHGMITGHYWVTGGHDPEVAARFYVRNLRNPEAGDFFVLDNEVLDDGNMYSDDEAARWIRTVQALVGGDPRRVFMYASGSPMKGSSWAAVRATGAQALVAWYDIDQWGFPQPLGSWAPEQIGGHQFTSSANLGNGGRVDANVFKEQALSFNAALIGDEIDMATIDELKGIQGSSFLPLCVQNREAGAAPVPGIAIFSNGFVEAITAQQWDAFGLAGAKLYLTTIPGHFAFFLAQAALLRTSYATAQDVEFSDADLTALAEQIAAGRPDLNREEVADAVAGELASRR